MPELGKWFAEKGKINGVYKFNTASGIPIAIGTCLQQF